ncbi:hypothetical protein B0A49_05049 [Cryomyces minteri]|uniref:4a-hydroxytetrahydrobiopterin dehydratase n=1 Tax=Cryomyces minteri TaxID=331657 RepID=A0A4U0WWA8_9PEZI|nr:hypothetical protein B0A49_05049 [Cryomyces minteri]
MTGIAPLFSAGEDESLVSREANSLTSTGRWALTGDRKGLERKFHFKTFKAAWDFMNSVATECKVQKHHPEWTNIYNKTQIRWTTHNPSGLSSKDIHMAKFCDEAAAKFGELPSSDATSPGSKEASPLEAGDCSIIPGLPAAPLLSDERSRFRVKMETKN